MKTASFSPNLDLTRVDAAIFNLDEIVLQSDQGQDYTSGVQATHALSSVIALLSELKAGKIKTALITANRNGWKFLAKALLSDAFDEKVDGNVICQCELNPKPEPDVFLKAADLLKVSPDRTAIFETNQAGVQAGRAGNFGVIVLFNIKPSSEAPKTGWADAVVADLCELSITTRNGLVKRNALALPSGLKHCQDFFPKLSGKSVVVFLDYDGTLTPIVDRPELAILSGHTRATLEELAKFCTVGVISGRDRANVKQMVNIDSLIYAGSHGFDISGPKNWKIQHEMGTQFLPLLDQIESLLHEQLDSIVGTLIERKKFSVAVHYRLVESQDLDAVRSVVKAVVSQYPAIRTIHGKKLYDLQPRIDWDKGKALIWLLKTLNIPHDQAVTFFFGDDVTDEDAFRLLQQECVGIVVEDSSRYTYATYRLNNPNEVDQFLQSLTNFLRSLLA